MYDSMTRDQLLAAREEINTRLNTIDQAAVTELEEMAKKLGYAILKTNGGSHSQKLYQNPDNPEEVYRGKGKRPAWLQDALEAGGKLEDFRKE